MSVPQRVAVVLCAAVLSFLSREGDVQAQQQANQPHVMPTDSTRTRRPMNERRSTTYFRGPEAAGANAQNASADVDRFLANCLSIKNQAEIEMNEFALERAQNSQVKQFAHLMIEDHRELAQQLTQLTGGSNPVGNPALDQVLQIDRQIAEQCKSMARDKLSQKSSAEFDQCFVGAQIGAHMEMLSALTVIADQADGRLQQVASEAKTKVQQHLQHAEQLAKQLESENRE